MPAPMMTPSPYATSSGVPSTRRSPGGLALGGGDASAELMARRLVTLARRTRPRRLHPPHRFVDEPVHHPLQGLARGAAVRHQLLAERELAMGAGAAIEDVARMRDLGLAAEKGR